MKVFLLISLFLSQFAFDATELKLDRSRSKMSILGTSSLHDWESEVNNFFITGNIDGATITDLLVEVEVKSIESGKGIMDSKTYEALKEKEFPKIRFTASSLNIMNEKVSGNGTLAMAGESKEIAIEAKIITQSPSEIKVSGDVILIMSEYGIDPPTAMFGTLKTGDQVTIKYELLLNK